MQGFEKYTEEMEKFQASHLFPAQYNGFLELIKKRGPLKSFEIEEELGVTGAEVRRMVQNARRSCEPVCSNGKGYFYGRTVEDIQPTIQHLKERRNSLSFTVNKMEKIFAENAQLSLF